MAAKKKANGKGPSKKNAGPRSRLDAMADVARSFGDDWRKPVEALERVSAVPTIWPQLDWKLRIGGWPIQRIGLVHGPSAHGKSVFVLGLGRSFLRADHFFGLCDAEQTTPIDFVRKLLGDLVDHPGFSAQRPRSYERAVDSVRVFADAIVAGREKGKIGPDTYGLIGVDSIRKLVPDGLLSKIHKQGAQKVGVDGAAGRAGQMRAALNGQWLDELVPLLAHSKIGLVFVARESENPNADPWALKYRVGGGTALVFDASLRLRVELSGYVREGSGDEARVIGERHKVVVHKSKVAGRDGRTTEFVFHTSNGIASPEGFDLPRDLVWMATEIGLIERQAGGWLEWSSTGERWHGENQAVKALHANPQTAELLERECREVAARDLEGRLEDGEQEGEQAEAG